ncbi:hypothetical protein AaE_011143 [Aphanomyces astaci]|uniref:Thioredoxin domain-containing protein n=1 Tax=Aphanomyces astaci TaxID=112090 RepID=A0A6A4ZLG4_APHAT|nr:hypothetical protein AaE_011143 [Aphanomyces astaci]
MAAKFSMAGASSLFGAEDHLEASDRMGQAMEQLKVREQHETQQRQQKQLVKQQQHVAKLDAQETQHIRDSIRPEHYEAGNLQKSQASQAADGDDDDEDDFEDDLDQDPDFMRLREVRLKQLQEQYKLKAENLAKGHGDYREILQDEFLKEVTSSARVLVHFYHRDFERCKVMDMHLGRIAKRHVEVKVLKIDAEKAPFFVAKLVVRVLPTIILFENGIANDTRVVGFEGLADDLPLGREDEFPTVNLARRLAKMGALNSSDEDEDAEDHDGTCRRQVLCYFE